MFRPREGHSPWLIEARLEINPRPAEIRWLHDVFGNSVGVARFSGRARELCFDSTVRLDYTPGKRARFPDQPGRGNLSLCLRWRRHAGAGAFDRTPGS